MNTNSSFKSKLAFFQDMASKDKKEDDMGGGRRLTDITPISIRKSAGERDESVLLILKDDILFFENEMEAYKYGIEEAEVNSLEGDDEATCPFVIKVADVDPIEYKKRMDAE